MDYSEYAGKLIAKRDFKLFVALAIIAPAFSLLISVFLDHSELRQNLSKLERKLTFYATLGDSNQLEMELRTFAKNEDLKLYSFKIKDTNILVSSDPSKIKAFEWEGLNNKSSIVFNNYSPAFSFYSTNWLPGEKFRYGLRTEKEISLETFYFITAFNLVFCLMLLFFQRRQNLKMGQSLISPTLSFIGRIINSEDQRLIDEPTDPEITELQALKREYNQFVRKLESREKTLAEYKFKNEFNILTKQIAHDLRTPTSLITSLTSLLSNKYPDSKEIQLLEETAKRIQSISNEILKKNRQSYDAQSFSISDFLNSVTTPFYHKNIKFNIELGEYTSSKVFFDETILYRIVMNLIKNSFEACSSHNIDCEVNLSFSIDSTNSPVLEIKDNGPGIDLELLQNIGKYRNSVGKKDGNGLGLYYVKNTLESLGGKFDIRDSKVSGAIATITLPNFDKQISRIEQIRQLQL